jgi:hypothetical protein
MFGTRLLRGILKQPRIVLAQHPGTGGRGNNHRIVAVQRIKLLVRNKTRVRAKARVIGRLTAASLILRKVYADTLSADQAHGGQADPWVQQVDQASAE